MKAVKYVRVTFSPPEYYFEIPPEWNAEDLQVKHGALYYCGRRTNLVPKDFYSNNHELEIIDSNSMDFPDCQAFFDC